LQTDADFSGVIVGEVNAGWFKSFLYLEDGGEVSFHDSARPRRRGQPSAKRFTMVCGQNAALMRP